MNDDDDDDDDLPEDKRLAKMRAVMDQGVMALREFAPVLWGFYRSLVEQGFTNDQAMLIVVQWFTQTLGGK